MLLQLLKRLDNEINYVKLLNGVLPEEIRAISWCPVDETFSSRFDCDSRSYRYYFPKYTSALKIND